MSKYVGKHVIVRTDRAGVFFGVLESKTGNTVCMTNVRKLFYWDGACGVEQIAVDGVKKPDNCKFTVFVNEMEIENPIQILPCDNKSIEILKNVSEWKN